MITIKDLARTLLPRRIFDALKRFNFRNRIKLFKGTLTTQEVFTKIYKERVWGNPEDSSHEFYSGSGSHNSVMVSEYVQSIAQFLRSFENKPSVVDLGCGDFVVGSQIRALCGNYIACDIVEALIEFNTERYKSLNIDFRLLDLTKDDLPQADILFIRQVLQHLSNKQIKTALPQISAKYKYFVLTEHLPETESFPHNLDIPAGPEYRLPINSGIVLTSAPFNLKVKEEQVLCQVPEHGGIVKTILYRLS